jgi:hypothetical protein
MTENTWEELYNQTFNNSSRNFAIGSEDNTDKTYALCSTFCDFKFDKWSPSDYIQGMSVMTSGNCMLRINPLVNTELESKNISELKNIVGLTPGVTQDRTKKFTLYWNGDFTNKDPALSYNTGGLHNNYELEDIFIQAPSKFLFVNSRYDMEVGLVFRNEGRIVVMVTPIKVSPDNKEPDDLTQKGLYKTMMSLSEAIPVKDYPSAVPGVEGWTPRMFLPREDKRKFVRWTDAEDSRINYIVFYSPDSALEVPYIFYQNFSNKLCGGTGALTRKAQAPAQKEPANTYIQLNENISPQPVEIKYKEVPVISPKIESTIHQLNKLNKEDKEDKPKPDIDKPDDDSDVDFFSFVKKFVKTPMGIIVVIVLLIIIILILFKIFGIKLNNISESRPDVVTTELM